LIQRVNSHDLESGYLSPLFLLSEFEKSNNGTTVTIYETESQLFPKKCEVKLHEHLKIKQREQQLVTTGELFPTKSLRVEGNKK
jgi:hypothetical protein